MSRLVEEDIDYIVDSMDKLDEELDKITGATLTEIADYAVGATMGSIKYKDVSISVVPVTSGLGIIGGFSQTVAGILTHMGMNAKVTQKSDVWGMYEGRISTQCQICADDDWYMACNNKTNAVSENGYATGIGFAAALVLACDDDDIDECEVLVAGAGPVGLAAAQFLQNKGADVLLFDIDEEKLKDKPYRTTTDISGMKFSRIIEATTQASLITEDMVNDDVIISAPGVPFGVEKSLAEKLYKTNKIIHNTLELGTAVMMAEILYKNAGFR